MITPNLTRFSSNTNGTLTFTQSSNIPDKSHAAYPIITLLSSFYRVHHGPDESHATRPARHHTPVFRPGSPSRSFHLRRTGQHRVRVDGYLEWKWVPLVSLGHDLKRQPTNCFVVAYRQFLSFFRFFYIHIFFNNMVGSSPAPLEWINKKSKPH